jgi:hypothetical protein
MAKEKEKENKNKSFVLRIDTTMMEAVEKWAADEFRSVNGQILYVLEQALKKNGRLPKKNPPKSQPETDDV